MSVPKEVIKNASKVTGLSSSVCKSLLEAGWTIEFDDNRVSAFVNPANKPKTVQSTIDMYRKTEESTRAVFTPMPKLTDAEYTMKNDELRVSLTKLINSQSRENQTNTPDYILADLMVDALIAFERATNRSDAWHGRASS